MTGCPGSTSQGTDPTITGTESNQLQAPGAITLAQIPMIRIPGGSFRLGSKDYEDEQGCPELSIASFELDKTEVTNAQYRAFLDDIAKNGLPPSYPALIRELFPKGKDHKPKHWGTPKYAELSPTDNHPVIDVDWYDALAFAAWAGKRLPTEAEWELAAAWDGERKATRLYPWGDVGPGARGEYRANYQPQKLPENAPPEALPIDDPAADGFPGLAPVGSFLMGATPQGVLDLSGNVAEWCQDWYRADYRQLDPGNPVGPETGTDKVLRGGHYLSDEQEVRACFRLAQEPDLRQPFIGFRCAR